MDHKTQLQMPEGNSKTHITQLHNYGCGAACVAFISGVNYLKVVSLLSELIVLVKGYHCRELVIALERLGLTYSLNHINSKKRKLVYQEGVIVFIRRSKKYPAGHYLVRHNNLWMDPWVNFPQNSDISQ